MRNYSTAIIVPVLMSISASLLLLLLVPLFLTPISTGFVDVDAAHVTTIGDDVLLTSTKMQPVINVTENSLALATTRTNSDSIEEILHLQKRFILYNSHHLKGSNYGAPLFGVFFKGATPFKSTCFLSKIK
jgi:hypothetical protein